MTTEPPLIANLEAEQALLGALMIDNRLLDSVSEIITADDFGEPLHSRIFNGILSLVLQGKSASPISLRPILANDPALAEIGGPSYLAGLTSDSGGLLAHRDFAEQIRDLSKLRSLAGSLQATMARIADTSLDLPIASLVDELEAAAWEASGETLAASEITIGKLFAKSLGIIEAEARGEAPRGVKSTLVPDMHEIADLLPGTVTILAGRPGQGKTALALSTMLGAAENGHGVAMFSLEMKAEQLGKRMISDLVFDYGNCPSFDDIKAGKFTGEDYRRVIAAQAKVDKWPVRIIDQRGVKIGRIAMMIRRMKRQFEARGDKLELVVIDYLQLVKPDRDRKSRYEEVGEISRRFKEIAGELGLAILLLAQVNRDCEKREDKRPMPFDLRDAGDIEQDADTIVFVYRDEHYLRMAEPDKDKPGYESWLTKLEAARDRVELYSAKRRDGETRKRLCNFFLANQAVRGSRYFEDRRA